MFFYGSRETNVSAINSKSLKVTFEKAVDVSKAKFEIKKGSVTVNSSNIKFSEDKKSAEIELASKLFEGEYTVNVTGLTDKALTGSVKVENEKVAGIEVLSETAPVATDKKSGKVGYKVVNQYNEDITTSPLATSITWTASNGVTATDDDKGVITLSTVSEFKTGDKVALTGINQSTNTVVSKIITISDVAVADTLSFDKVYHQDGKAISGNVAATEFALLLEGKDQYGNTIGAKDINDGFIFTSSNPSVLAINTVAASQGADKKVNGLKFTAGANYAKGGKVIITAISKATGSVKQFEIDVKAAPALETFSVSAPTEIVAAGETVKLAFSAVDQYGTAVTKYDDIAGNVQLPSGVNLTKDAKGNAVLEYIAGGKGLDIKVFTVIGSGKVSQLTVDVKEAAYAATIESLKDVTATVAKGGTTTIKYTNLVVKDQYGRTFDLKDKLAGGKYTIKAVDSSAGAVKVAESGTEATISSNDGSITITGTEKGSEDVTLTLYNKGVAVATSPLKVSFSTVEKSAYTTYEVANVATLYADGEATTHTSDLKVYGVKADGSKVVLPSGDYTVIPGSHVAFSEGKLNATVAPTNEAFKDKDQITSNVTVVIDGDKEPVTIKKDVVISKVAPKAETIEFKEGVVSEGVIEVTTSTLALNSDATFFKNLLKVTDQYGKGLTSFSPVLTATNLNDNSKDNGNLSLIANGTEGLDITNAGVNDTFVVTYLLDGKTVTAKFVVKSGNADKAAAIVAAEKALESAEKEEVTKQTAYNEATEAVTPKETAYNEATEAVTPKETAYNEATEAVTPKQTAYDEATEAVTLKQTAYDEAPAENNSAEKTALDNAKEAQATAKTDLDDAKEAQATAKKALDDAKEAQATAKTALDDAKEAQATAKTALDDAKEKTVEAQEKLEAVKA